VVVGRAGRETGDVRPTFLFDGDCAFCSASARFVERRIPTPAAVIPWQRADLAALGVTREACIEAVQWIGLDGVVLAGPVGIAALLRSSNLFWRPIGWLLGLRPMIVLAWPIYRWVSHNRHRLPGGTPACAVTPYSR
jgi:predicted DCC family thiol-disulfide oxidoreductase YuxK